MKENLRYFRGSMIVAVIGLILGGCVGFYYSGTLTGALSALFITSVLAVLEVSLSFDNAVVNASLLREMTPKWRRRFLTWGMLIAVFGMRIVFPLIVVSVASRATPLEALRIAVFDPERYSRIMLESHLGLAGFGSAFLMMVALGFFFNPEKTVHWIHRFESIMTPLGKFRGITAALCLLIILLFAILLPEREQTYRLLETGALGVATFVFMDWLSTWLGQDDKHSGHHPIKKASVAVFIQLEFLDASFSFDGVIGAFALTSNLFIMAAGLGIGAMFVRSLTLLIVDRRALDEFRYLEHGAFYAIGTLAFLMLLDVFLPVPEAITGLAGAALILTAILASGKSSKTSH